MSAVIQTARQWSESLPCRAARMRSIGRFGMLTASAVTRNNRKFFAMKSTLRKKAGKFSSLFSFSRLAFIAVGRHDRYRAVAAVFLHLIAEKIEQQQCSDSAAAFAVCAERIDLFFISHTLRFAHQANFFGFRFARFRDVVSFALGFAFALFGAFSGDFHADRCFH